MLSHNQSPEGKGEFRPLTPDEQAILGVLLGGEFPGKDALVEQSASASARQIDSNGSLEFSVSAGSPANVVRRIPVEAEAEDQDGVQVHVLLHVLEGLLAELEVYREDSGPLQGTLDPDRLRILIL